eukprot:TRINITY_DN8998_c0_g1_i6.p1 TRINITY_DN8998_c0_g1~~TRINITY_DN8998_c0_g1_i6.p1  ORF type:complete len:186 (-),score=-27.70 TRINITY_DN8998_c0_g1_i6:226-783(-)
MEYCQRASKTNLINQQATIQDNQQFLTFQFFPTIRIQDKTNYHQQLQTFQFFIAPNFQLSTITTSYLLFMLQQIFYQIILSSKDISTQFNQKIFSKSEYFKQFLIPSTIVKQNQYRNRTIIMTPCRQLTTQLDLNYAFLSTVLMIITIIAISNIVFFHYNSIHVNCSKLKLKQTWNYKILSLYLF